MSNPTPAPVITVYSWKAHEYDSNGNVRPIRRREDWRMSGISGGDEDLARVVRDLRTEGHVILTDSRVDRPWNHHMIGVGVGHDDAKFAETGQSAAAYYENGEAWGGNWWENESALRHYQTARTGA